MSFANAIAVPGHFQRESSHVEPGGGGFRMNTRFEKGVTSESKKRIITAEIFIHKVKGEYIVACRDRRVGCKDSGIPDVL